MRIQNKLDSAEINLDFSMLKWTHDTVFILNKRLIQLIIGIGLSFLLTNCTTKNTQADEKSEQGVFELMDSSKTGVMFRNDIVEYDSFNYFYYDEFYEGAGTGIIDVNNDGLQDLFFVSNQGPEKLYLNKGNFQFEDISAKAGIEGGMEWSNGVTIADVNGDGFQDIYISCRLSDIKDYRTNRLYINNKDNTFTERAKEYGIDDAGYTAHASFFDFDLDGDLDLYVVNQPPNSRKYKFEMTGKVDFQYTDHLFENVNGRFVDITKKADVTNYDYGLSVMIGDISNDGYPDIYVANDFDHPDILFLNNQDGTFKDITSISLKHMSTFSMGGDIADMNNDGWLDLIVVDMVAEDHYRNKTNMSGMNPKKFWDLVKHGYQYQYMYNSFQLNQGNGLFSEIALMSGISNTDWSWTTLLTDFNNDGTKDAFITNGLLRDVRNKDFNTKWFEKLGGDISSMNPINAKKGSVLEMINMAPSYKIKNYMYSNTGDLLFKNVTDSWNVNQLSFSQGASSADLDNDGDLDLIVNNMNDLAFVYRNKTTDLKLQNYFQIKLEGPSGNKDGFGARVKLFIKDHFQMQEMTNVRGYMSTSEPLFHFGLASETKIDSILLRWPDGTYQMFKDVNANQRIVVKYTDANPNKIEQLDFSTKNVFSEEISEQCVPGISYQENEYDDFKKEVLLPHKMSTLGPCLATADVNGDGKEDFYLGGAAGKSGQLFLQNDQQTFDQTANGPWLLHKAQEDLDALFFDADGDGDQDLYVVSGSNEFEENSLLYQDRLYLNNGKGNFQDATKNLPTMLNSKSVAKSGDFDRDGDLDLFVGGRQVPMKYGLSTRSYILINEMGSFQDQTERICSELNGSFGMVTDAWWLDLDNDKDLDLAVVGEWMPLTILINDGGKLINKSKEWKTDLSEGWWNTLAYVDIDEDGDIDLLGGNLGLNSKFKASLDKPFNVYLGDFDKNGTHDTYLGSFDKDGKVYPVRGRQCSSEQMPFIKDKFRTYNEFALASIDQVLEGKLDDAVIKKVHEFRSGVFVNMGTYFEFKAFPNYAQIAPIYSFALIDINRDKHVDLIYGGNYHNREVETTRSDAGVGGILLNRGNLKLESVPSNRTGLFLNNDLREMRLILLGNFPVLLTANNNQIMQANKIYIY